MIKLIRQLKFKNILCKIGGNHANKPLDGGWHHCFKKKQLFSHTQSTTYNNKILKFYKKSLLSINSEYILADFLLS